MKNCRILFLCLLVSGCDSHFVQQSVTDSSGENRLQLVQQRVSISSSPNNDHFYDFDSLVWLKNNGIVWRSYLVISQVDFQARFNRRRWVTSIYSFNPTKGTCILKIAEGDAPESAPHVKYNYSWREWNLLTNGEVHYIRDCTNPFEKY